MGALHLTFTPKFPQNEGFQLQIWHFLQTFSDEKIFDNFSTVKNLGFATASFPHPHPRTPSPFALLLRRHSQ